MAHLPNFLPKPPLNFNDGSNPSSTYINTNPALTRNKTKKMLQAPSTTKTDLVAQTSLNNIENSVNTSPIKSSTSIQTTSNNQSQPVTQLFQKRKSDMESYAMQFITNQLQKTKIENEDA